MKKDFIHLTVTVLSSFLGLILLMSVSCSGSGGGTTSDGIVIAQHKTEDIPASVDHMRYAVLDDKGNRTYLSSEFPVSALHKLEGIPKNTMAIVTEFHTENKEELSEDIQPISFTNNVPIISPQYSTTEFLPRRLAIVDMHENGNILVRGNLPLVKTCPPDKIVVLRMTKSTPK